MRQINISPVIITSMAVVTITGCQLPLDRVFQVNISPSKVVGNFLVLSGDMKASAAYDLLSRDYKSRLKEQEFKSKLEGASQHFGAEVFQTGYSSHSIIQESIDDNNAVVMVSLEKPIKSTLKVELLEEDGKWKIDKIDESSARVQSSLPTIAIQPEKRQNKLKKLFSFISKKIAGTVNPSLFPIMVNGRQGYINEKGEVVIEPKFNSVDWLGKIDAPEGFAIWVGDRAGYANREGKVIIQPIYDSAFEFKEGLGRVSSNNKYGFVDAEGNVVVPLQFPMAEDFTDGRALVQVQVGASQKTGFIDATGKMVIDAVYDWAIPFSEGITVVQLNGKSGLIDTNGKTIVEPKFDSIESKSKTLFREGFAQVQMNGKYGFIDKSGNVAIQPQFDMVGDFHEGLASLRVNGNPWREGFIDKTGKIVIEPKFNSVRWFSEGLAAVEVNKKWGYINRSGGFVIAPQFEQAFEFKQGMAIVSTQDGYGAIDTSGKVVIPTKFPHMDILGQERELWRVQIDRQKWGYIDRKGNIVWAGAGSIVD
jgi:WG containing repeat